MYIHGSTPVNITEQFNVNFVSPTTKPYMAWLFTDAPAITYSVGHVFKANFASSINDVSSINIVSKIYFVPNINSVRNINN